MIWEQGAFECLKRSFFTRQSHSIYTTLQVTISVRVASCRRRWLKGRRPEVRCSQETPLFLKMFCAEGDSDPLSLSLIDV